MKLAQGRVQSWAIISVMLKIQVILPVCYLTIAVQGPDFIPHSL
jgi:hypothetical protein